ncbi:MAG: hypothetical protein HY543_02810 [Deltaproteobacteria bacterium]|nr:hypothetical protein [Deltaproteobacteria bacterium]
MPTVEEETTDHGQDVSLRQLLAKWWQGGIADLTPRLLNFTVFAVVVVLMFVVTWASRMPAPMVIPSTQETTPVPALADTETPPAQETAPATEPNPTPVAAPVDTTSATVAETADSADTAPVQPTAAAAQEAVPAVPAPATPQTASEPIGAGAAAETTVVTLEETPASPALVASAHVAETTPAVTPNPRPRRPRGPAKGHTATARTTPDLPELQGSIPFNSGGPLDLDNESARKKYQEMNIVRRQHP